MSTLGQKLKTVRENLGLTQEEAAEQLGIKRPTLANWEIDRVKPDLGTIKMLASFYRLRPEYLLDLDDDPTPPRLITPVAIGEKIKQAREEARLSQAQLAQKIGQTVLAIKYFEKGSRKVLPEQLGDIARATGKPLSFFIPDSSEQAPEPKQKQPQYIGTKKIPIIGNITAGGPNIVWEYEEAKLEVPADQDSDFAVRVVGDSMIGAGIVEGDIAVCKKAYNGAQHGQLVAALLDRHETTLKYLVHDNDVWKLRAANPKYLDRVLNQEIDVIQGIVVSIVKRPPVLELGQVTDVWGDIGKEASKFGISPEQARRLLVTYGKMQQGIDEEEDDDD